MTSSAALRVKRDKTQGNIPEDVVKELIEILVDISEFSTVHCGDIVQRNHDALGNTLLAFYCMELISLVRKKSRAIALKRVTEFTEWTIKRVKEIIAIEKG
ncbi:MAG: hypothetical protein ACM3SR_15855 [Ignavibacteriales bacterium]